MIAIAPRPRLVLPLLAAIVAAGALAMRASADLTDVKIVCPMPRPSPLAAPPLLLFPDLPSAAHHPHCKCVSHRPRR